MNTTIPDNVITCLPSRVTDELLSLPYSGLDEIRLRAGGACSVTCGGRNFSLASKMNRHELDETMKRLCLGSLYAFADTIKQGYITLDGGIRVGLCGRAVPEGNGIGRVYDVSSLCIRLPHKIEGIGGKVVRILKNSGFSEGVLIYSLPGVGKTTLLRSVIESVAGGYAPIRVAVVDTRGELGCYLTPGLCVDLLSGYPKGAGIEIAVRTLNPQLIVCDEIGSGGDEAQAIKAAQNSGVPLLASAHAGRVTDLLRRPPIKLLHDAGIFGCYVGISRGSGTDYRYTCTTLAECG